MTTKEKIDKARKEMFLTTSKYRKRDLEKYIKRLLKERE